MGKKTKSIRPKNFNDLAKDATLHDKEGREMNIGQVKQVLKYVRWCFQQDPVGMFKLFTKGM